MSLDVYLNVDVPQKKTPGSRIFVRDAGSTREISREEWDARFPGQEPVMRLDNEKESNLVYSGNVTHNLGKMARVAGIYEPLWRPDEIGVKKAAELIEPLEAGLKRLQDSPGEFKQYNPRNGWGDYEGFVAFVQSYLAACRE